MPDLIQIAIILVKIIVLTFTVVLPLVPISVYFERRFSPVIQDRVGPNRVGIPLTLFGFKKHFHFFGLIQPMADGLKLFLKEDFTPSHVRKAFYWLAPALTVVPALITVCVIPFGSPISIFGHEEKLLIADLDIGPLFATPEEAARQMIDHLHKIEGLEALEIKESWSDDVPFERLMIKVKPEIVTMRVDGVDAIKRTGPHLPPEVPGQARDGRPKAALPNP